MMNILIPMAGRGSRFSEQGYKLPKPLIDVNGKPMIVRVLENLELDGRYIFLVIKEHSQQLRPILDAVCPWNVIIEIDKVTEGAACTCLLAKEYIDNSDTLVVANCDQLMVWNKFGFGYAMTGDVDGLIMTFTSDSPKNSYVKTNRHGYVMKVAEKEVISNEATCGVYHWSKGKYMVDSCEKMIQKNLRVNNEFYLAPCYNELIEEGYVIKTFPVFEHSPIGTPEDLKFYLEHR